MTKSMAMSFYRTYWTYYLELEREVLQIGRYVDIDKANRMAFSIEILKVFQAVCGEIDSVAKEMVFSRFPNKSEYLFKPVKNIYQWWYLLDRAIPTLSTYSVRALGKYPLKPWKGFKCQLKENVSDKGKHYFTSNLAKGCHAPAWWNAYNKVKHQRAALIGSEPAYHRANLGNMLCAIAGLYSLEFEFAVTKGYLDTVEFEETKLFSEPLILDAI